MEDILVGFSDVQVRDYLPMYVQKFLRELPDHVIFLHKISSPEKPLEDSPVNDSVSSDVSLDHDVTGSPLMCTMYSLKLDDTVTGMKKCWSDEETHLPISLKDARTIVSRYLTKAPSCHIPLWVVCDGLDASQTVLLSGFKNDGWFSRTLVCYEGIYPLHAIEERFIDFGEITEQIHSDVSCVFSLFQQNSFDNSLNVESFGQIWSNILVKLKWHHPSIKIPCEGVSAFLSMDLTMGHTSSSLYSLWCQLNDLKKYYEMLCRVNSDKKYVAPAGNTTFTETSLQTIAKEILNLINNPKNIGESLSWMSTTSDVQRDQKHIEDVLKMQVKQVVGCTRPDSEITDKIWLILIQINDVNFITDCLNDVLSQLGEVKSKTYVQINVRKNTSLTNIICAQMKGELAVTEVSFKKSLEIMIEIGIEKLKQDYIYIFKILGIECFSYFKSLPTSITKSMDVVKYNMNILTQLHVALDFILAAQSYFNITGQNLNIFAQDIFGHCNQKDVSLESLANNSVVSLEVPVNSECVINELPDTFQHLKFVKSSKDGNNKDYFILLLSSVPIFPPSIFRPVDEKPKPEEENDTCSVEQQYYVYKLSCWCDYVGKQN